MSSTQPVASPVFPVLDTLRAVGALAVLTTHVAFQSGEYVRHGVVGPLLARLDIGVAIFFVLSGFLLARPWLARAAAGAAPPSTAAYLRKRWWRIYPLYVVTVAVALLVVRGNDASDAGAWLRALTMTDVFTDRPLPQGLTQMWSLSVEVTFYAVLPLLMRAVAAPRRGLRTARAVVVLGLLVLLSGAWNLVLADAVQQVAPGAPLLWLPAHLTWFVVGVALAFAHVRLGEGSRSRALVWLRELGGLPGVCWGIAGGLLLMLATPLGGPVLLQVATPTQSLAKHLGYAVIAGLVVLTGVMAREGSRYATVMSLPWLRHLGLISYGIFSLHLIVLEVLRRLLGHELFSDRAPELWLLTIVVSVVVAEIAYRLVERPGMRLGHTGLRRGGRVVSEEETTSAASATTTR